MNPVKHVPRQLVLSFVALFLLTSIFAQELPSSRIQTLTPERILGEPSLNGELLRQLHWSNDGVRLACIQSSSCPARASQPQKAEIWSIDPATAHRSLLVSSAQL